MLVTDKYLERMPYEIDDEKYFIGVTRYKYHKGSLSFHAASDLDFYGYAEIEFDLLNKDGEWAREEEKALTEAEHNYIREMIINRFQEG